MVTMKDVARLAGVSTATVSRILNDPDAGRPETRRRVVAAVKKLGYEPNVSARNLRIRRTATIIVVLPDINNPFFSFIVRGIEDVAHEQGFSVLLCNTDNDLERELQYTKIIGRRGADGAIFLTARVSSPHILTMAARVPVVLACEYIEGAVSQVSIDNVAAALDATRHLIQLGHKRIAYVNGPPDVVLSRDRLRGYTLALKQAGLPIEEELIVPGTFYLESGVEAARRLLSLDDPPTAVFCANDEMAIGFIKEAYAMGRQVPDDVAVVGFDDIRFAAFYRPALTTIAQPMYEIGQRAARLLLDQIAGKAQGPESIVLPHRLVVRESCGAGARGR
ncbi:MAG: LacI family transcriptional regulator [Bacillota bacterium]|nr:MAG: LacI family transcriptional regulator [Bacillota bacterium]